MCSSGRLGEVLKILDAYSQPLAPKRKEAAEKIIRRVSPCFSAPDARDPEMDEWVRTYFHERDSIAWVMEALFRCRSQRKLCSIFFRGLEERSPTSLALTLHLLRHNQGRPMDEVYAVDSRAARFMVAHPDFVEGIRARIIDKDDSPQWRPQKIEDVDLSSVLPQIFAGP